MAKFSKEAIAAMQSVFNKSQYTKREWKVEENKVLTLDEYAEYIDPMLKHIEGNPMIIAKPKKDGNFFLKMSIPLEGGSIIEFDLSYKKDFEDSKALKDYPSDFEEDDEIDIKTIKFGIEKFLDKEHGFMVGKRVK